METESELKIICGTNELAFEGLFEKMFSDLLFNRGLVWHDLTLTVDCIFQDGKLIRYVNVSDRKLNN